MSRKPSREDGHGEPGPATFDRRNFLKIVGAGATASALPLAAPAVAGAAEMQMDQPAAAPAAPGAPPHQTFRYLNSDEASFIEAAVDTLIPHDDTGPGALELGVANFIDQQLAAGYGKGDRFYLDGPFPEGATPQQGYQLPLTPAQLMRAGMLDVNAYCMQQYKNTFSNLSPEDISTVLTDLQHGKAKLDTVPAAVFFDELWSLTLNGYFSDPMYGGNLNGGAWQMLGFPGADAMYHDKIGPYRNKPYKFTAEGIEDLS